VCVPGFAFAGDGEDEEGDELAGSRSQGGDVGSLVTGTSRARWYGRSATTPALASAAGPERGRSGTPNP
jgi:hypothetical protein